MSVHTYRFGPVVAMPGTGTGLDHGSNDSRRGRRPDRTSGRPGYADSRQPRRLPRLGLRAVHRSPHGDLSLIGQLPKFWRIRGEIQPPAAYPHFRLRMVAVCKTAPFALLPSGPRSANRRFSELAPAAHWNG